MVTANLRRRKKVKQIQIWKKIKHIHTRIKIFPRNLNNGVGWGFGGSDCLLFSITLLSEFNKFEFFIGVRNPWNPSRSAHEIIIFCQEHGAYVQVQCIEYKLNGLKVTQVRPCAFQQIFHGNPCNMTHDSQETWNAFLWNL